MRISITRCIAKEKTRPEGLRDGFASDRVEKLKTTLHDSSASRRESLGRIPFFDEWTIASERGSVTRSNIKRAEAAWNANDLEPPVRIHFLECGDMSPLWLHGEIGEHC